MHEASLHDENSFITLTYNDENLPPDGGLVLADWQNFAKKIRRDVGSFRFFHAGEYGTDERAVNQIGRPHYHACIFGMNWLQDRKFYKMGKSGSKLYTSKQLENTWGKGYATIGELTLASAAYVAAYVMKKRTGKDQAEGWYDFVNHETGECTPRRPEYATMSRNPGIGKKWFEKWNGEVYPSDELIVAGRITRPPKYYDTQLKKLNPAMLEEIKIERQQAAEENKEDNTEKRLRDKEKVAKAKDAIYTKGNL